ncbi:hypothetical protein ELQ90_03095 [Labedella phragmitis]|uniref:Tail tube protein n=1 Tax=Labedella phragmitis TaxID=2498849 RepID=A0A3S4DJK5_9MICO|nr:hypothetical protein [Labedella phragmitis]RWZ52936.1 hypothetical protein ELQ90_03095 [Labedella phragmitis]
MSTRTLGPGSLKIGETASAREWAGELSKCAITVDTSAEDPTPMLDGSEQAGEETYAYVLALTLQQNYEFDSLEMFCFANRGKELPFVFTPNNAGGIDWSGTVRIRPVNIGGDVKKRNTSDAEFPIVGEPTPGEVA